MVNSGDNDVTGGNLAGENTIHALVDARNLNCPMPLLKAKQALSRVALGQVVEVFVTDASSVKDFHAFAELTCHEIVHFKEAFGTYTYHIRKGQ